MKWEERQQPEKGGGHSEQMGRRAGRMWDERTGAAEREGVFGDERGAGV